MSRTLDELDPPVGTPAPRGGPGAPRGRLAGVALAAGLLLISLNLRIGVASVGPVLTSIRGDLGLSAAAAGLLTTIPVVAFGAFAFLAPWLTRRVGMHRLLGLTMAALAAGIALRLEPSLASLYAGTIVIGAAIAIANVLMPAVIKLDFAQRIGLLTGLYSTALFLSAALGDGLTVPLLPAADGDWRSALALWSVPAAVAFLAWIPQLFRSPGGCGEIRRSSRMPIRRLAAGGVVRAFACFYRGLLRIRPSRELASADPASAGETGDRFRGSPPGKAGQPGEALGQPGEAISRPGYAVGRPGDEVGGPADAADRTSDAVGRTSAAGEPSFLALLTDPVALAVTALMGIQAAGYYATLTWLPTLLQDHGMDPHRAGWMLSYSAFPGIAAALVSPGLARRIRPAWVPVALSAAADGAAYAGLAIAPVHQAYLWMTLLGLGQGASISLSLSYIAWRSPDARHTAQLSTMAQGFGYLLASLGPIGIGAIHAASGNWTVPLIALAALLAAQLAAGAAASRDRQVLAGRGDTVARRRGATVSGGWARPRGRHVRRTVRLRQRNPGGLASGREAGSAPRWNTLPFR